MLFPDRHETIIGRITRITHIDSGTEYVPSLEIDVNGGEFGVLVWQGVHHYPTVAEAAAALVGAAEVLDIKFTPDQFVGPETSTCPTAKGTISSRSAEHQSRDVSSE